MVYLSFGAVFPNFAAFSQNYGTDFATNDLDADFNQIPRSFLSDIAQSVLFVHGLIDSFLKFRFLCWNVFFRDFDPLFIECPDNATHASDVIFLFLRTLLLNYPLNVLRLRHSQRLFHINSFDCEGLVPIMKLMVQIVLHMHAIFSLVNFANDSLS